MELVFGPWVDGRFYSDAAVLREVAAHSRATAATVLLNRTLPTELVASTAERVPWTQQLLRNNYRYDYALMNNRDRRDQVAIIKAAAKRSTSVAETLANHLSAEAMEMILADPTAFAGRTAVVNAITGMISNTHRAPLYAQQRGFSDVIHRFGGPVHQVALEAISHIGDAEALLALTPRLVELSDETDQQRLDEEFLEGLLLSTHGVAHVVRHWGEHGGLLGARVAATDHRQEPAWLVTLEGKGVAEHIGSNPAVGWDQAVDSYISEMAAAIRNAPTDQYSLRELAHKICEHAEESQGHGQHLADVDAAEPEDLEAYLDQGDTPSALMAWQMLISGKLSTPRRAEMFNILLSKPFPIPGIGGLLDAETVGERYFYRDNIAAGIRPDLYPPNPEFDWSIEALDNHHASQTYRFTDVYEGGMVSNCARYVSDHLQTSRQLLSVLDADTRRPLSAVVAECAVERVPVRTATAALFGNALGAL